MFKYNTYGSQGDTMFAMKLQEAERRDQRRRDQREITTEVAERLEGHTKTLFSDGMKKMIALYESIPTSEDKAIPLYVYQMELLGIRPDTGASVMFPLTRFHMEPWGGGAKVWKTEHKPWSRADTPIMSPVSPSSSYSSLASLESRPRKKRKEPKK